MAMVRERCLWGVAGEQLRVSRAAGDSCEWIESASGSAARGVVMTGCTMGAMLQRLHTAQHAIVLDACRAGPAVSRSDARERTVPGANPADE